MDAPLPPTPSRARSGAAVRAKSHVLGPGRPGGRAATPWVLTATLALTLAVGCGGDGTGEPKPGPAAGPGAGAGAAAEGPGGPTSSVGPEDLMEPLVGERRLAPEAIEVDPLALMPAGLPIGDEDRERIAALVRSLQPLDPTLTSDHHDRWFIDNKVLMEQLEASERPELGWAALHAYSNYPQRHHAIRKTLLTVGARVAPEEAAPLLAELAFSYGYYIEDRSEALLLLAEVDPEALFAGSRAHLERQGRPEQTGPNDEFHVEAWRVACETSGRSMVPMMSQVATNLALEPYARVIAVRALAPFADDPRAEGAIRTALVESTGDGYLRRISAQTVLDGFPKETACELLAEVAAREADVNFARFLDDVIQTNCR